MPGNTSFAKRLIAGHEQAVPDVSEVPETHDETALSRRSVGQAAMLEFRLKSGERESLGYSYLWRANYHPQHGIRLIYPSFGVVEIKGHGLAQLHAEISAHKRSVIEELSSPAATLSGKERPHVSEIKFDFEEQESQ